MTEEKDWESTGVKVHIVCKRKESPLGSKVRPIYRPIRIYVFRCIHMGRTFIPSFYSPRLYVRTIGLWRTYGLLILGFKVLQTLYPADYGFFYTGARKKESGEER
jgi:hypothetical protein